MNTLTSSSEKSLSVKKWCKVEVHITFDVYIVFTYLQIYLGLDMCENCLSLAKTWFTSFTPSEFSRLSL